MSTRSEVGRMVCVRAAMPTVRSHGLGAGGVRARRRRTGGGDTPVRILTIEPQVVSGSAGLTGTLQAPAEVNEAFPYRPKTITVSDWIRNKWPMLIEEGFAPYSVDFDPKPEPKEVGWE